MPTLGRSGLRVSAAALGTMNFGTDPQAPTGETEARRIVGAFLDGGHNLIDTADIYRGGTSEEIVGRAIAQRRDDVVLASKAGARHGLSRRHLTRALEASLRRLGTDHIDLYQCHRPDPETPIEETMQTLDAFVRSGKVRYAGCSNFTAAGIVAAQWAAERVGGIPLVSLQANYSVMARAIEAEIVPVAERHGLGVLAYSPLGSGLITGRYRRDTPPEPGSRLAEWAAIPGPTARRFVTGLLTPAHFALADEVAAVAAELHTTAATAALSWLAKRPAITSVILGPRTIDQLTASLTALHFDLPEWAAERLTTAGQPSVGAPATGEHVPPVDSPQNLSDRAA